MCHRFKIILVMILIVSVLLFQNVAAEEVLNNGAITVSADSLTHEKENDIYLADGNVMVLWNDGILIAETISLNGTTNEAVAVGGVRLVKGGSVVNCDRLSVNLQTEKGEVINGNLFDRRTNFRIHGERIEKLGRDEYRFDHGIFTTCDGDLPSWKFSADDLDVTLEEFAYGKNTLFYVKDIPVLYTPYILFPVKRERQTGFLIPRIGNSSKKGFFLGIPFYWAVSPSQEVLLGLDVQTKRGVGLAVDYNWLRPRESHGKSHGYYIYDFKKDKGRGNLALQIQEWIAPSLALKSDIDLVTDRDFFRDFADESGRYNRQILDSSISLSKNWQSTSLAAETRYVQDVEAPGNSRTLQKLPDIRFSAMHWKIKDLPLYLGLDSSFVNFYHDVGTRGQRIDIYPSAAFYFPITDGFHFSAWGGYRGRFYNAYDGDIGNGSHAIGLADAGAKVVASFTKTYETDWGALRKLRHVMVPEMSQSYIEQKDQDSLPAFDYNDRVPGQSITSWALTNYITGKFQEGEAAPEYRDLLYLKLSQGYQLSGARRDLLTLVDDGRHITDLRIEANLSPVKALNFFTDSRFNTYEVRFSTIMAGFDLNYDGDNSAGLSYRYSRDRKSGPFTATSVIDPENTSIGDQVDYLDSRVRVGLLKPFVFNYRGRYSFDRGGFLETSYSLEFRQQCWSVELVYYNRPVNNNRSFMVNFSLSGLGSVGKYKAF